MCNLLLEYLICILFDFRCNGIKSTRSYKVQKTEELIQHSHWSEVKMADKLRPDELAAFKAAFDMFDKNQDGTISTKVSTIFK